ncbi:MAG TPA: universal stress protein [Gaiellaceae bacterium]|nr:universal stress protein [Gaiellaceae bacterium]
MRIGLERAREIRKRARRLARRTAAVGYRSIVVPLLGRAETEHALDLACRLASERRAQVILVAPVIVAPELPLDAQFDNEVRSLRVRLDRATAIASAFGVGAKRRLIRTRAGALGRELAEVVVDHRAELVVVGAPVESRRGFRRAFPAEILTIVRDAPSRVMIVSGRVVRRPKEQEAALRHILVPMKLGEIGEEMVATAIKLARHQQATVQALHVIKVPLDEQFDAPLYDLEEQAAASLAEAAALGADNGVEVVGSTVRARSIGEAIVAAAAEREADLIVLGSSPRWRRQARFFSPTVDYVLRHAGTDVLVIAFPVGVLQGERATLNA